jgi:ABC-2 type transport system permease protein
MKKKAFLQPFKNPSASRQALRGGSYSLAVSALVLAILVVVNVFVSALPASMTRYDISASKLYSITSNTKAVIHALDQDVTIYWIVQSGEEDDVIETLLGKYESLSDHIQVVKKNPDVSPAFAQQYTSETVQNNSLVVECGEKSRFIGLDDIYLGEVNMYSGSYEVSDFDGEGAITSAIDYVTSQDYPQLYLLEGHGEAELPDAFAQQIEKENLETTPLSLLTANKVPEDADCVVIYAPESDISPEEKAMLSDYVAAGGNLWVSAGAAEDRVLENLSGLLADYGVTVHEGVVIDPDRDHYALNTPSVLLPDLAADAITDPLAEGNYRPVMPVSAGLSVSASAGMGTVTELLTTSDLSFSKAAGLTSYEKEAGDEAGPFSLGVSIEAPGGGRIIWFTSDLFLEELYNALSSGANGDLAMNALSSLIGESEAMAIRSKPLGYDYLTISDSASSLLKFLMLGAFPLAYLGIGICVVVRRKKMQHASE